MNTTRKFIILAVGLLLISYAKLFAQSNPAAIVESFIQTKYPGAVTVDIDYGKTGIEVEIVHRSKEKDLDFNSNGEWLKTSYELSKSELPSKIKNALKLSSYSSYSIDDIEFYETPKDSYYEIDLEKWFSDDVTIYISSDGKIL